MALTIASSVSLSLPPEVARAVERAHRSGPWPRGHCPYCDPEGRKSKSLAVGERGWLCHRCHAEQDRREDRARLVQLQVNLTDAAADEARRSAKGIQRFEQAGPLRYASATCPGNQYLIGRCLKPVGPEWFSDMRVHARTWHPDTRREYAALIAAVRRDDMIVASHATYLLRDGRRADHSSIEDGWRVQDAKRSLGPITGGAVRLGFDPDSDTIGVGEGIESTLALAMKLRLPCWSGLSAGGVAAMRIPSEIRRVIIGPDIGDKKRPGETLGAGMKAAIALRQRLLDDVRRGKRTKTIVEFLTPPVLGDKGDWADWAERTFATAASHP